MIIKEKSRVENQMNPFKYLGRLSRPFVFVPDGNLRNVSRVKQGAIFATWAYHGVGYIKEENERA